MKEGVMLTIASRLSILFMTFHFTDDLLRKGGMAKGGASNLDRRWFLWYAGGRTGK